ncbi:MAG: hypothetical protein WCB10_11235 [Steroidobacteraceae bacterium]
MATLKLANLHGQRLDALTFCARVYDLFEQIRGSEGGASNLRMRRGKEKKRLIEELLPICKYVQTRYRHGHYIEVTWVDGNQQYDARLDQRGGYVDREMEPAEAYLEVTGAMHPNDYLLRERIDKEGFAFEAGGLSRDKKTGEIKSEAVGHANLSHIHEFAGFVAGEIEKKASKKYPEHTTLIVNCVLNIFDPDEWDVLLTAVRDRLPPDRYRGHFREIFLCDHTLLRSHTF